MTSSIENPHLGTSLDDFLAEDGLLDSANRTADARVSAWQGDKDRRSLWQVAQSGYDVFVSQDDGPLVHVTDENADALGVNATAWDSDASIVTDSSAGVVRPRIFLNFKPRQASNLYVVYSAASTPDQRPQELCVQRQVGAGGDTVYVNGFGYLFSGSDQAGHAIRLGGVGDVYRRYGDGHAIRYDGAGKTKDGECYDVIRRHLGRIAHIAQVDPDAPSFDPGHGDVERGEDSHSGIALRAGDGPGTVHGEDCRDDRPKRRRNLPDAHYRPWPSDKKDREDKELEYFFRSWIASDSSLRDGDLVCVDNRERPDRIVRNRKTGKEYGVELTSVYLDDKSVIDHHRLLTSRMEGELLLYPEDARKYRHCIAKKVREKIDKAQSYDNQRDLILAVYLNERVLYRDFKDELRNFMRRDPAFRDVAPFVRIVFTGIGHGVVYP